MSKKHKQVIIMGGGLSGLITAAILQQSGVDFILLEALDEVGGNARCQMEKDVWLDFGLKSIPVGDVENNPLIQLKKLLNLDFSIETVLEGALSNSKSGFTPFVGFGESKNRNLIEQLQYYVESPRFLVSNGWKSLIEELQKIIPAKKILTKSHITKIETVSGKINSVTINGEETFTADVIISALPLNILVSLLPPADLTQKTLLKYSKMESFTALSLDLATEKPISTQKNMIVLSDDGFYVIGQFVSQADPLKQSKGLQISTWMTLMDEETALDDEAMSKCLKTMKKLIKKAYPTLQENASWERILVAPQSHTTQIPWASELENLYVINAQTLENSKYIGGIMTQAMNTAQIVSQLASSATRDADSEKESQTTI